MNRKISTVKVRMDGTDYSIKAGTFMYDDGFSEYSVENTSNNELVFGEDITNRVGMMKFELDSTTNNLDTVRKFQRGNIHTIQATDSKDPSWSRTMNKGISINGAEKGTGSDGSFELTFKGSPLV